MAKSSLFSVLTGKTARDAEMRYTPEGKAVTTFSIPVTHGKNKKDEWQTTWVDVKLYGTLAEQFGHTPKGTYLTVAGNTKNETWETDNGEKKSRLALYAVSVTDIMGVMSKIQETEQGVPSGVPVAEEDLPF